MTKRPACYYVWQPCFEGKKAIASVFLTPGYIEAGPEGGREFFETVLLMAGLQVPLLAWGIEPFLTTYFSPRKWTECWEVRLLVSERSGELKSDIDRVPVTVAPAALAAPKPFLPLRVLADFPSRRASQACKAALREQMSRAKWHEIHLERVRQRLLLPKRTQLAIDVLTIELSRPAETVPVVEEVMHICAAYDGQTWNSRAEPLA